MTVKIKIEGLDAVRREFTNMEAQFDTAISEALAFTVHDARNKIIKAINGGPATGRTYQLYNPKRTHTASAPGQPPMTDQGALVRSIAIETAPGSAMVGSNLVYAAYLEYGTRKMAPRPIWTPVAEMIPQVLRANIERELAELIR